MYFKCEVLQLGVLSPTCAKTRDKIKTEDENSTQGQKERNKLDFSPKIDPHRSFTPIFCVFFLTWPFTAAAHILHY
jgi:hypothetical protein